METKRKIICPNCDQDISYYYIRGKKDKEKDILKILDDDLNQDYFGIDDGELRIRVEIIEELKKRIKEQ